MTTMTRVLGILLLLLGLAGAAMGEEIRPLATAAAGEYIIGVDDVLEISVYKRPEMTKSVTVRSDGMITYELVGSLNAAGRTASDLDRDI
ncbi:MAG TPA: polysaccharide biosynthesis/export family protein, partial [bacterium]|nr:polysaccharide biosynthesis/export family protein [bacterium]